ncbi:chemerin-like receptor 1 [Epinephelus fuscoguttatus]|uniref:chemerin-like receptor 1 n=1 Tax=Epinephelus fuscoguttatus TaxID=293821 RepID=UPI0020D08D42|nr:chemerin-like receptor 1 [Epinephelus fuscoguttatus]
MPRWDSDVTYSTSGVSQVHAALSHLSEPEGYCAHIFIRLTSSEKGLKTKMENVNTTDTYGGTTSWYYDYETFDYVIFHTHAELRRSQSIMSVIVYCLAFVLGVLGNEVVIYVTGFKMKKTVHTVWFLNLAVADFLFTAFLPLSVIFEVTGCYWPSESFMCKLSSTLISLNIFASVYILMVISVDRCVSVVWPVWAQNYRSVLSASYVSLSVWILALILSSRIFIFNSTGSSYLHDNIITSCKNLALYNDYTRPSVNQQLQAMTITFLLLGFVVPFTVIFSCYAVIIHRRRRNRNLASQSSRPFKILTAVIITFFLCLAPYHIIALTEMINDMPAHHSQTLVYIITIGAPIATSLAIFRSCLNPLLYVLVGQDYNKKVITSILSAIETAFQEDVSDSHTESVDTRQSTEMSVLNTDV